MTDARVSRAQAEALVAVTPTAQVSRAQVEALTAVTPTTRVSRAQVEILMATTAQPPPATWWNGSTRRPARVKGWWDGSSIQPLKPPYIH
jgi:hypothetical protein